MDYIECTECGNSISIILMEVKEIGFDGSISIGFCCDVCETEFSKTYEER